MVVINPSTFNQTLSILKKLIKNKRSNPFYLRLGRQPVQEYYEEENINYEKVSVLLVQDMIFVCVHLDVFWMK